MRRDDIVSGEVSEAGARPRLQIECGARRRVPGGFDSRPSPPPEVRRPRWPSDFRWRRGLARPSAMQGTHPFCGRAAFARLRHALPLPRRPIGRTGPAWRRPVTANADRRRADKLRPADARRLRPASFVASCQNTVREGTTPAFATRTRNEPLCVAEGARRDEGGNAPPGRIKSVPAQAPGLSLQRRTAPLIALSSTGRHDRTSTPAHTESPAAAASRALLPSRCLRR